jgi:carbonic anhydrase/acetyltransferase-like protein (isoleucine patch superfamily)
MDEAYVGENSIIGALCFVPAGMKIPANKIVVGNPAKIVKDASPKMVQWKYEGTLLYQDIARESLKSLKPCEPLREVPKDRIKQTSDYEIWSKVKDK